MPIEQSTSTNGATTPPSASKHSRSASTNTHSHSPLPKRTKPSAEDVDQTSMSVTAIPSAIALESASQSIPLQVKLLSPTAKAPTRGSKHSAGYDIYVSESGVVPKWGRAMLSTGCAIAIPPGTYARVAPRSGLAVKHGIATGAGVIDFDYRGEVKLLLFNHSDTDFKVEAGDRMAQLVLERIVNPEVQVVSELDGTERGAGGFGSTGGFGEKVAEVVGKKDT